MSSEFFKKLQPLFESATRQENVAKEHRKLDSARKAKKESGMSKNAKAADTDQSDREYIARRQQKEAEKKASNLANVKENAVDFFRKYSDIVTEADTITASNVVESYDDDEDPDVAKAMSVKGRDGKKQADVEKKNKWSFDKKLDKADKKAEEKGAKKAAKDNDLTEAKKTKADIKSEIKATNDKIDAIVKDGGRVSLTDPLTAKLNKLKKQLKTVTESYNLEALEDKLESLKDDLEAVMGDAPGDDRNRSLIRSEISDVKNKIEKAKSGVSEGKDSVTESWDDDEDPDVTRAMSVKGKDGKTQKDADKKLPPWLNKGIDKADKKAEEEGAKKAAKDKDLTESQINEAPKRSSFGAGIGDEFTGYVNGKYKKKFAREDDGVDWAESMAEKHPNWEIEIKDEEGGVVYFIGEEIVEDTNIGNQLPESGRQWIKNSELGKRNPGITETVTSYQHIQKEVKDMDKMSPEQLQQYADGLFRELNKMKRWIRNEFSDSYANLKKDPTEAEHWSIKMCDEYIQELKAAKARGATISQSGGAKASTSIGSDSRGLVGGGPR